MVLFIVLGSFCFGATHTVTAPGLTFSPSTLTIITGDTVVFDLSAMHNAVEVSQATWNADNVTPLPGGFAVDFGGGTVVLTDIGTHYYVCQAHASFGMKGTITVNPVPPPPSNNFTINSIVDQDGDVSSTGDQLGKNWGLKLYMNSISPSNLVASIASGQTLTPASQPGGTFIAVEEDSTPWTHIGVRVDGTLQGSPSAHSVSITVTLNETHTIDFINYAPNTIISSGFTFSPDSIAIMGGTPVYFVLDPMHTAREVSKATWNTNGTTSNGGFDLPSAGGTVILSDTGTHYYVCVPHASLGMKGIIRVNPPPPNTVKIFNYVDQNGNPSSTGDEILKKWGLNLYRSSISPANLVNFVASSESLSTGNLGAGTYIATEADSESWSPIAIRIDGVVQNIPPSNNASITVTSGETHTIDFIDYAPHTIISSGYTFLPDSIAVIPGDTVHFVLDQIHTAREVDQSTWDANDFTSNGGFDLPFGGGSVIMSDTSLTTHYYVCTPHAFMGMKGRIVVVAPPVQIEFNDIVTAGWNMVSMPVLPRDKRTTVQFPGAGSGSFAYQNRYTPELNMDPGTGYWLKFNAGQTFLLKGIPLGADTLTVVKGWNMIGSVTYAVPFATIGTDPVGIIQSSLYGYNNGYFSSDTVVPGKAYWLKTSLAGRIFLDTPSLGLMKPVNRQHYTPDASRITFTDAAEREQTLSLLDADGAMNEMISAGSELPPLPPEGGFDVRFASGRQIEISRNSGSSETYPIAISAIEYPIIVRWETRSGQTVPSLHIGDKTVALKNSGSITLTAADQMISLESGSLSIPATFVLHEAYPDPFNPVTTIRYELPSESNVDIRIYNMLGQAIATLTQGVQPAGVHSLEWNAQQAASGMYIVRMVASSTGGLNVNTIQQIKIVLAK